ncbi:hypothetical protein R3P38DRAFT_3202023 [Favolaschia claudopus]|uniref:Uncharacterized protein n=1 Tax=Favolaschia claudopus TaxID=2862362 RepID=A0AAW0ATJ2_9AGAR
MAILVVNAFGTPAPALGLVNFLPSNQSLPPGHIKATSYPSFHRNETIKSSALPHIKIPWTLAEDAADTFSLPSHDLSARTLTQTPSLHQPRFLAPTARRVARPSPAVRETQAWCLQRISDSSSFPSTSGRRRCLDSSAALESFGVIKFPSPRNLPLNSYQTSLYRGLLSLISISTAAQSCSPYITPPRVTQSTSGLKPSDQFCFALNTVSILRGLWTPLPLIFVTNTTYSSYAFASPRTLSSAPTQYDFGCLNPLPPERSFNLSIRTHGLRPGRLMRSPTKLSSPHLQPACLSFHPAHCNSSLQGLNCALTRHLHHQSFVVTRMRGLVCRNQRLQCIAAARRYRISATHSIPASCTRDICVGVGHLSCIQTGNASGLASPSTLDYVSKSEESSVAAGGL